MAESYTSKQDEETALRLTVESVRKKFMVSAQLAEEGDGKLSTWDYFFLLAIPVFYDHEGITRGTEEEYAGHLIFHLSNLIPKEERLNMAVYPDVYDEKGSIILQSPDGECVTWYSLEDWRQDWVSDLKHQLAWVGSFQPRLTQSH